MKKAIIALIITVTVGLSLIAVLYATEIDQVYSPVVIAIAIVVVIVVIIYEIAEVTNNLPDIALRKDVIIIFSLLIGLASIFMYISVIVGDPTKNTFQETKAESNGISIFIERESTVSIPVKAAPPFPPRYTAIIISIYHNNNFGRIQEVSLSTTGSVLDHSSYCRGDYITSSTNNVRLYMCSLVAKANHNFQVGNFTLPYTIDVLYSNDADVIIPQIWSVPFGWSVLMEDMDIFSYFWIVLIGVIASRLLSLVLDKAQAKTPEDTTKKGTLPLGFSHVHKVQYVELTITDYIWIAFSFIIAILIFSSFSTQVQLTTNIIANISLAFGFGFGFDKVLEVSKRFQNVV